MWEEREAELDADPAAWSPARRARIRHDIDAELRAPDLFGAALAPASSAARGPAAGPHGPASAAARATIEARPLIDRRGHGVSAVCGELLAGGQSVLAVCADARRRADGLATLVAGLALDRTSFAAISWS